MCAYICGYLFVYVLYVFQWTSVGESAEKLIEYVQD